MPGGREYPLFECERYGEQDIYCLLAFKEMGEAEEAVAIVKYTKDNKNSIGIKRLSRGLIESEYNKGEI